MKVHLIISVNKPIERTKIKKKSRKLIFRVTSIQHFERKKKIHKNIEYNEFFYLYIREKLMRDNFISYNEFEGKTQRKRKSFSPSPYLM